MKKLLQLSILFISIGFLFSCGSDDEPAIAPIVGEWELKEVVYSGAPAAFASFNGQTGNNLYAGETKYVITFNADQTYLRELRIDGGTFEDDGEWELDGDDLLLDQDDTDFNGHILDFELEEDVTAEDLVISGTVSTVTFPDAIFDDPVALDTIDTQEEANAFAEEWAEQISFKATLEFEKQ